VPLARVQGLTRTLCPAARSRSSFTIETPSHGVACPTTLAETGSDLHRAYRTRLCCAFRLPRPLDALFRLQPLRPYFMSETPLGFDFQRVSPPGSWSRLRSLPLLSFLPQQLAPAGHDRSQSAVSALHQAATPRVCASGRSVPRRVRCYPRPGGRSSPSLYPSEASPRNSAPCFHEASSHGLRHVAGRRTIHLHVCSSESQRTGG
jgi:hypothetical protein